MARRSAIWDWGGAPEASRGFQLPLRQAGGNLGESPGQGWARVKERKQSPPNTPYLSSIRIGKFLLKLLERLERASVLSERLEHSERELGGADRNPGGLFPEPTIKKLKTSPAPVSARPESNRALTTVDALGRWQPAPPGPPQTSNSPDRPRNSPLASGQQIA